MRCAFWIFQLAFAKSNSKRSMIGLYLRLWRQMIKRGVLQFKFAQKTDLPTDSISIFKSLMSHQIVYSRIIFLITNIHRRGDLQRRDRSRPVLQHHHRVHQNQDRSRPVPTSIEKFPVNETSYQQADKYHHFLFTYNLSLSNLSLWVGFFDDDWKKSARQKFLPLPYTSFFGKLKTQNI